MRAVRFVHRWLGLLLAAPLMVQGLSGAVLTLEPVVPTLHGARAGIQASPNRVLNQAREAAPAGMRPIRFVAAQDDGAPVLVHLARSGGERGAGLILRLDPVTATPLGPPEPESGIFEWIKRLHENWLMPQWGGRQFAGWLGVGLLLVTLLGIPLWWPSGPWRDGFTVPRRARGLVLHRRLHAAVGIWVSALLVATSTTGIIQGFPQTARAVLGLQAGGPPRPGRGAPSGPPPIVDLDEALRLAADAVPGAVLRMATLPASPAEPIRLFLGPSGSEGVRVSSTVSVDAGASRVLAVSTPFTVPAAESVLRWGHDLHFGQGFGPVWRGLTVVTGFALPLFAVTGAAMWLAWRRNRRRVATLRQHALKAAN